jgi:hypothetical protein
MARHLQTNRAGNYSTEVILMAAAKYTKAFMPLVKVKEKEFLSRPMGCRAVGFSLVRYKPGEGAAYVHRHKVQEECSLLCRERVRSSWTGSAFRCPREPIIRVAPTVCRALGNDSKKDVIYMILGAIPAKNFPLGGRTLLGDGIPNRKKVPRWKKA